MWESRRKRMHSHKNLPLNSFVMPVLRELAHAEAKPWSIILKKSWQSGKVPTDWKRRNPLLESKAKRTQGATGQSSHLKVRAWISKHEVAVVQLLEYKQILWSCDSCSSEKVYGYLWQCWNTASQWFYSDPGLQFSVHKFHFFGVMGLAL